MGVIIQLKMDATLSAAHKEGVFGRRCNEYNDAEVSSGGQKEWEGNQVTKLPSLRRENRFGARASTVET
jgi:hypothetical protein